VRARCRGQKNSTAAYSPLKFPSTSIGLAVVGIGPLTRRSAGKYVVMLFGALLGRRLHFARLLSRRCNYILARISKCRCAKRQRDKRDAASSHPTNQAGQPEWCFHIWIMQHFWAQHNDNRSRISSRYCQRKCSSRNCPSRALASSLRGPLAATNFS